MFKTDHKEFVKRRDEWFAPSKAASVIIWQMDEGKAMPTVEDAFERLTYFRDNGPSETAFTWQTAKDYGVL